MPLYEYTCRACGHQFEALVRASTTPACPECQSQDLERLLSAPAVTTEERYKSALGVARKKQAKVQAGAEYETRKMYEHEHDH